jgi:hypothetical protein
MNKNFCFPEYFYINERIVNIDRFFSNKKEFIETPHWDMRY